MKKVLMTTLFLAALTTANAQGKVSNQATIESNASAKGDDLATMLRITPEQTEKLKTINATFAKELKNLSASGLSAEASQERMAIIRKSRDTQLESVLGEDQFKKLTSIRDERRDQDLTPGAAVQDVKAK